MIKILHAVKGGLLSYCDKVYSRGNINQKHRIGGVMVSRRVASLTQKINCLHIISALAKMSINGRMILKCVPLIQAR
jgi:hypothetical protein